MNLFLKIALASLKAHKLRTILVVLSLLVLLTVASVAMSKNAIREVMIAGNLGDMLRDTVAVSQERENSGYWLLPWVRVKGVTISGK